MSETFDQVPELEYDETVPPRPEEEVADVARAVPDPAGHGDVSPVDGTEAPGRGTAGARTAT